MMRLLILLFILSVLISAQPIYTDKDVEVCNSKFELAVDENLFDEPINKIIIEVGKSFIGLDYEAHTIEKGDKENLVIHLTGLDCYTFLESSLVFARCIKRHDTTFTCFQKELQNVRYRNGEIKDYPSRLHYFSDWIDEMDKRGIGENITEDIGGIPYEKKIDFMSTHPDSYEQLRKIPAFVEEIKRIESDINLRAHYYIPQNRITEVEDKIHSGDILGITTNIKGLDISHTGIAIRLEDARIYLLHAPNVGKKVQISEKPLSAYINSVGNQTGIMVLRPLEPVD